MLEMSLKIQTVEDTTIVEDVSACEDVMFAKKTTEESDDVEILVPSDLELVKPGMMNTICEIRSTVRVKDVAKISHSMIQCHERSLRGGSVVKKRCKGTPRRNPHVSKLRKLFEESSSPTATGWVIEQLPQPSAVDFNPNLATTTRCAGQTRDICVNQPKDWIQTRPRQGDETASRLDTDWVRPAVPDLTSQSHHLVQGGWEVGRQT